MHRPIPPTPSARRAVPGDGTRGQVTVRSMLADRSGLTEPEGLDLVAGGDGEAVGPFADLPAPVVRLAGAAVALPQLLRLGPALDLHGALVAESLTYGLLQSGSMYRSWLARHRPRQHVASARPVLVERDGARLVITLNRPDVRNAFDVAMR